jgi:hypothetical protein
MYIQINFVLKEFGCEERTRIHMFFKEISSH